MTPTVLTPDETSVVLKRLTPTGKEYAAARIARMLAGEHSVHSVRINSGCSTNNISDTVLKCINPRICDLGLHVACVPPPKAIPNKFGQPTSQCLWSFYRHTAANDPVHDQEGSQDALRRDLSALQPEHPRYIIPCHAERSAQFGEALRQSANDAGRSGKGAADVGGK